MQQNLACVLRLSALTQPHCGQVWLVWWGGTAMSIPPLHASLYSSCLRNSPQPWSRMLLFKPALARTFLPGLGMLPAADLDMFLICKFSMTTIAWFWLMALVAWCR